MEIYNFFSGSSGNCTFIKTESSNLLIDCGKSKKQVELAMKDIGVCGSEIDGILITHEHSDHIAGLANLSNAYNIPIYVHEMGAQAVIQKGKADADLIHTFNKTFCIKDVEVKYIKCSHDAAYCCAYRLDDGFSSFASVTDTGVMPTLFNSFIKNTQLLLLESNYDLNMLRNGLYPHYLKERIESNLGHLSNFQAADVIKQMIELSVKSVWLGHLSENNNSVELAYKTTKDSLAKIGAIIGKDIEINVIEHGKGAQANVRKRAI
ncbi:MAG: MBL fold metallo-hydrolase [Clostridia bacterium]